MKATTLLTIGLCAALGSGALSARTWTSADGTKTFVGDFKSYDDAAAQVTVTMQNGRTMSFSLDKLSEDDQAWVKEQPAAGGNAGDLTEFNESDLGKALKDLKILEERRFVKHAYETPPQYFILYFSASW